MLYILCHSLEVNQLQSICVLITHLEAQRPLRQIFLTLCQGTVITEHDKKHLKTYFYFLHKNLRYHQMYEIKGLH